jgi:hypothetical protein
MSLLPPLKTKPSVGVRSRAYLPLLVLLVIQGMFIAIAPSISHREAVFAGGPASGAGASAADGLGMSGGESASGAVAQEAASGPAAAGGSTATGGSRAAAPRGAASASGPAAASPTASVAATGADLSHCTAPILGFPRQHGLYTSTQEAPQCVAKWPAGKANGGATYAGVTGTSIKVVIMEELPNDQVNAILKTQDLAMSEDDRARIAKYGTDFINKHYETYGRHIDFIRFKSQCPVTPPDVATCKDEARKIVAMKPFAVIWGQNVYPEVFDEFARNGIISLGGWNWADSYFTERRPYRYDLYMTGTKAAQHVIEYYCKKLARKPATNAGLLIHPTIGDRTTPRKLGILVDDTAPLVESAQLVAREIAKCDGGRYTPEVVTFSPDTNQAAQVTEAVTSKMINSKSTTVMCWCGPLEMTGFTKSFTAAQYYPEHLVPGIGLSDADVFAQTYDPAQWSHAFGPSEISDSRPKPEYQYDAVYKDAGDEAHATLASLLYYLYMELVGIGVQMAGPNLNPSTYETGMLTSKGSGGGDPKSVSIDWGPGDYGGYADCREVYFDPQAVSAFDNAPGAYVVLDDHKRFKLGQWTSDFKAPPAAK